MLLKSCFRRVFKVRDTLHCHMLSKQKVKMQIYPNFIQEKVCRHMYFLNPFLVYSGKKAERKIPKYYRFHLNGRIRRVYFFSLLFYIFWIFYIDPVLLLWSRGVKRLSSKMCNLTLDTACAVGMVLIFWWWGFVGFPLPLLIMCCIVFHRWEV